MSLSDKDGHTLISLIQQITGAFELALEAKTADEKEKRCAQAHNAARKAADVIKIHTKRSHDED